MFWGRYLIDAIFRNGSAHSNHGHHTESMIRNIVKQIRKGYREDISIIFVADTGFMDQKVFQLCDDMNVGFIVGGKFYHDMKITLNNLPDERFHVYSKDKKQWFYCEFNDKRGSWKKSYRTIYAKPITTESGQVLLEFDRPETIIYTNLGMKNQVTDSILALYREKEISAEVIINTYHFRARDELVNRGFKDFGIEQLPFKSFTANAAYYYLMAISFFLFETFKYDMGCDVLPITWYANTFRRRVIDVAGKIVDHSRQLVLKLPVTICKALRFTILWEKSGSIGTLHPLPA
jgi:hypothetical protein